MNSETPSVMKSLKKVIKPMHYPLDVMLNRAAIGASTG